MLDVRHLRYIVAVAEQGHVTRAAERLGIQQPPLSQQIRQVEAWLGAPLFRRLPRGMEPTEAGRVLVERAQALLRDLDLAVEDTRRTARGEQGRLAIGFTGSAGFHPFVTTVVRALRADAPGVTLALEEANTTELVDAVREGRLDAAFIRSPAGGHEGIVVEPLLEEPMLAALPDSHRLATSEEGGRGRRKGVTRADAPALALADLAGEDFVLYRRPSGPGLYDGIIAACHAAGFSPRIVQEAPRLVSTLSLVAAGLGVTLIPDSVARLETQGIAYRRLRAAPGLAAPLHLAWRPIAMDGARAVFLALVRQERDRRDSVLAGSAGPANPPPIRRRTGLQRAASAGIS